ncbi:hypothetical protein CVT24_011146 [Panaeolus cyanescens]|uniref:Uncharacterized protein n=1 Tax=Panaeolus cyanescens TaxID=181874 RepID=A0A409YG64_9AGAR|nr:hypothetical protein CVT24_011146 [Panaeolus cyanescens]
MGARTGACIKVDSTGWNAEQRVGGRVTAPAITQYEIDDGDAVLYAPPSPPKTLSRLLFFQSPVYPYDGAGEPSQALPVNPRPTFTPSSASNSNKIATGTIIGAVFGGIAAALAILGIILIVWRKKKQRSPSRQLNTSGGDDSDNDYLPSYEYTPFRRSAAMIQDFEQASTSSITPYEDMRRRESESEPFSATSRDNSTMTSKLELLTSGTTQPEPSFGVIPPMKMREAFRGGGARQQELPLYSC